MDVKDYNQAKLKLIKGEQGQIFKKNQQCIQFSKHLKEILPRSQIRTHYSSLHMRGLSASTLIVIQIIVSRPCSKASRAHLKGKGESPKINSKGSPSQRCRKYSTLATLSLVAFCTRRISTPFEQKGQIKRREVGEN